MKSTHPGRDRYSARWVIAGLFFLSGVARCGDRAAAETVVFNLVQASAGGIGEQLEGTETPQVALVDNVALSGVDWTDRGEGGQMNATAERFGPNAVGSGDDADGFDVDENGTGEFWEFRFDLPGSIVSIDFRSFTVDGNDTALLTIGDSETHEINATDVSGSVWTPSPGSVTFAAGESLRIEAVAPQETVGDFWQLQKITIDTNASPVAPGDMNGDGNVTLDDVGPFILALTDRRAFVARYPTVHAPSVGDMDTSGTFDLGDLSVFSQQVAAAGVADPVPEPASCLPALISLCGVFSAMRPPRRRNGPRTSSGFRTSTKEHVEQE